MLLCRVCCVLCTQRGLCDGLIPRPKSPTEREREMYGPPQWSGIGPSGAIAPQKYSSRGICALTEH